MIVLGVETSCDDTCVAIIENNKILTSIVSSQTDIHKEFGGVVPELASRDHLKNIQFLVEKALFESKIELSQIDFIAVTYGPGLVGALLIGLSYAKSLAYALNKQIIGVNHIEAHLTSIFLEKEIQFPYIGLVVSGGHTLLYKVNNFRNYEIIGRTCDDAAGEAFDKIAKFLNLGYPGGVIIDKISKKGKCDAISFPRPMLKPDNFDFSFSGLKTSFINHVKKNKIKETDIPDLVCSFQEAIVDTLVHKTKEAARKFNVNNIVVTGGVACNSRLREKFNLIENNVYFPSPNFCTDNAAMVAHIGYRYLIEGITSNYSLEPIPSLKRNM